jgi:hypothetical protein
MDKVAEVQTAVRELQSSMDGEMKLQSSLKTSLAGPMQAGTKHRESFSKDSGLQEGIMTATKEVFPPRSPRLQRETRPQIRNLLITS